MIEKHIVLEDVDPVVFYGVNNTNIQMIKALYPKLRIVARGNIIKVMGDEEEMCAFEENIMAIEQHCVKYNSLKEEDILAIIKGHKTPKESAEGVIVYSVNGKPITARSENQQKLVKAYENNDMIFAIGPAGSGKTYTSIALAVRALKNKEIRKIILSRPAVEAGEKLGFLPGDLQSKIDPYLRPLYDALFDLMGFEKSQRLMERQSIEVAPLAYMRGRTLNNAFVILDEAQNTTPEQMKMFLTRIGFGSKAVITGDVTQIDLPKGVPSGLKHAIRILDGVRGIEITRFTSKDVVRHPLVARIVDAYEEAAKQDELAAKARKEVKE